MKVLVVGVGFMGALHARTVQGLHLANLCGVVDRNQAVADTIGAELDVPAFVDQSQAIQETHPDVVVIATPDPAHRDPAEIAIKAGLSVLIEKPLATVPGDAEAIVALAQEHNVRLMAGHLGRFLPRYIRVADSVRSGDLGKPVMITTSTWGRKSLGARVSDTTNPLWHFAIHDIDVIQWITGGVIDNVDGAQFVETASGVSTFAATGSVTTGSGFHMATGWTLPDSAASRFDLRVHCERGVAQATWSGDGVALYTLNGVQEPDCMAWPTLHDQVRGALLHEVEHFLTAIIHDTPFVITPEEAVNAVHSAAKLEQASVIRSI